jgi:hypothetical protein
VLVNKLQHFQFWRLAVVVVLVNKLAVFQFAFVSDAKRKKPAAGTNSGDGLLWLPGMQALRTPSVTRRR